VCSFFCILSQGSRHGMNGVVSDPLYLHTKASQLFLLFGALDRVRAATQLNQS